MMAYGIFSAAAAKPAIPELVDEGKIMKFMLYNICFTSAIGGPVYFNLSPEQLTLKVRTVATFTTLCRMSDIIKCYLHQPIYTQMSFSFKFEMLKSRVQAQPSL